MVQFLVSIQNGKDEIRTMKYETFIEATTHYFLLVFYVRHGFVYVDFSFLFSTYENSIYSFSWCFHFKIKVVRDRDKNKLKVSKTTKKKETIDVNKGIYNCINIRTSFRKSIYKQTKREKSNRTIKHQNQILFFTGNKWTYLPIEKMFISSRPTFYSSFFSTDDICLKDFITHTIMLYMKVIVVFFFSI